MKSLYIVGVDQAFNTLQFLDCLSGAKLQSAVLCLSPLSSRSVFLKWKLYLLGSCRRCCCAVRPVPSPSIGTVIKSLSEKPRATQNRFSIVKGSFYNNILKYPSIHITKSIMSINLLNVSFSGKDILGWFCSFIKSAKCFVPEQIAWINVLYGPQQRLNTYIESVLLDFKVQPYLITGSVL